MIACMEPGARLLLPLPSKIVAVVVRIVVGAFSAAKVLRLIRVVVSVLDIGTLLLLPLEIVLVVVVKVVLGLGVCLRVV